MGSQAPGARLKRAATDTAGEPSRRHHAAHSGPVLVDSGPLIALFNAADHWHGSVLAWLAANPAAALLSTWPVATEVCALLARRISNDCALDFLRWAQRGGIGLDSAVPGSLTEVLRISERFASLPFDLADASIAEAASRWRIRHVLTIDADFDVYRDKTAGESGQRPQIEDVRVAVPCGPRHGRQLQLNTRREIRLQTPFGHRLDRGARQVGPRSLLS